MNSPMPVEIGAEFPGIVRKPEICVHPTDGHSNKLLLSPPSPDEVARLAQLSRGIDPEATSKGAQAAPHRSLRRRLSPRAIDELVDRYTAGEETPALSREFGISASGLRDLLRATGVTLRGHAITPKDIEKAVHLYTRGLTITEVVARIGYSHSTIRKVLLKQGVAIRSGSQRKRVVSRE